MREVRRSDMITTRPIGRPLGRPIRHLIAVLALSTAAAGLAEARVGGVTPFPTFEQPRACPAGKPALTPDGIRTILKRQGYYAIRGLRYLKPSQIEWIAPANLGGHYVATASKGFGIVRWQLTVDPCTAQVAVGRRLQTRTH